MAAEDIRALVVDRASRYSIDPRCVLAATWTECRFDQARNSPRGARGPMQLMPDTAMRFNVADACAPAENLAGGMRFLGAPLDGVKSPIIAAAAYDAGEQASCDSGGLPACPETVRYVASEIKHQLGLALPGSQTVSDRNQTAAIPIASNVIGARVPMFVGGVMQF